MKTLTDVVNYLWIGLIPNSLATYSLYNMVEGVQNNNLVLTSANAVAVTLNAYIGYGKFEEYKEVKRLLEKHGWDERIVKPKSYSWCQRHAAKQAAEQTGYSHEFDELMQREGHKWYHVVPKIHKANERYHSTKSLSSFLSKKS